MSLLTLIGCINYQLSLGYLITFLMMSLWVSGAVSAARSLSGLHLRATPPPEAWAGSEASFAVHFTNPTPTPRLGLRIRLHQPRTSALSILDVPASSAAQPATATATVRVPVAQRGPYTLPRLRLEGRDPLGLWRGVTYPLLHAQVLVYPQPEADAPPLPSEQLSQGEGERRVTGQEDFAGIRPYQPGDAPRRVAWKQSARTGELQSKLFDAPASQKLKLDFAALRGLDTEARLSRLSAWVLKARQENVTYRLQLPQQEALEGSGEAHMHRSLRLLALYGLSTDTPAATITATAPASTPRGRK